MPAASGERQTFPRHTKRTAWLTRSGRTRSSLRSQILTAAFTSRFLCRRSRTLALMCTKTVVDGLGRLDFAPGRPERGSGIVRTMSQLDESIAPRAAGASAPRMQLRLLRRAVRLVGLLMIVAGVLGLVWAVVV